MPPVPLLKNHLDQIKLNSEGSSILSTYTYNEVICGCKSSSGNIYFHITEEIPPTSCIVSPRVQIYLDEVHDDETNLGLNTS